MADDSSKWKACRTLEWNTELPYSGMDRMSPVFRIRGIRHCFRFHRDSNFFYVGLKLMDEASRSRFTPFRVTVHVELKQGSSTDSVYGPCTVACNLSSYYMYISKSEIASKLKDDLLHYCNMMKFLFTFYNADELELPGLEDKRAEKIFLDQPSAGTHLGIDSLSRDLEKLLDPGDPSADVVLRCGDREFKAHRCLLTSRSEVFASMLRSDMLEGKTGRVEIRDIEANLFELFVRYLYTGKLPEMSSDAAMLLYEIGDRYSVDALRAQCGIFLKQNLTPSSACDVLLLADRHSDSDLKEGAIEYMLAQKIPLRKDVWKNFSSNHPVLAVDILNRFCELLASSK